MPENTGLVIDCGDPAATPVEVPLTPEQEAARDAIAAAEASRRLGVQQELAADEERLQVVIARSATDPDYRALADLALKGVGTP